jgi:hypothetical protein
VQDYVIFRPRKSSDLAVCRPMQNVKAIAGGADMKSVQFQVTAWFTLCRCEGLYVLRSVSMGSCKGDDTK